MTSVLWFRRDLRLADHPALTAAAAEGPVLGLFVIDPRLWSSAGSARRAWVAASVRALAASTGGSLLVRVGDPAEVVPSVAREVRAGAVHVTGEGTPYGRARDLRVAAALTAAGVAWRTAGTPYAVTPGTVRTQQGGPYQVFTPFFRAWREQHREQPLPAPEVEWATLTGAEEAPLSAALDGAPPGMPEAGEDAAHARWNQFREVALAGYAENRDLPAVDGTSRLSPYLKVGAIHPRQLLADLSDPTGRFAAEVAWREFYADVLHHRPGSVWHDLRPLRIAYDDPGDVLDAWKEGRTGYPVVDAGMRQLRYQGWMHNRVRMIVASFLTKDLHLWWPIGARHFLDQLIDGDIASNNHGWQWVAGTGTDAAPYFRVFNPVAQGRRFDPTGEYVRQWVPELAHLPTGTVHEPWKDPRGYDRGYPERMVDHDVERRETLDRYAARGTDG